MYQSCRDLDANRMLGWILVGAYTFLSKFQARNSHKSVMFSLGKYKLPVCSNFCYWVSRFTDVHKLCC